MQRQWKSCARAVALAAALLLAPVATLAQGEKPVSLDQLLRLPSNTPTTVAPVEKKGGRTRVQWQERYRTVRKDMENAEKDLAESRAALEERMGEETGQWKMAAPGMGDTTSNPDTPTDFRLSQQLRRDREEVARAEIALRDLDVEANLAGIPEDWRMDADAESASAGR